jgi:hypothetical protein
MRFDSCTDITKYISTMQDKFHVTWLSSSLRRPSLKMDLELIDHFGGGQQVAGDFIELAPVRAVRGRECWHKWDEPV